MLKALRQKVKIHSAGGKLCTLKINEISFKESVEYNAKHDDIEGAVDFGVYGREKIMIHKCTTFMVRGINV